MRELTDLIISCKHEPCGELFFATRRDAEYCSPKCRTAAHRARQKPSLLQAIVNHQHRDLIPQWNATRQLSDYAGKLILEIYRQYGYDAARLAIVAANAQYDNVYTKTEAHYQAEETARAEQMSKEQD